METATDRFGINWSWRVNPCLCMFIFRHMAYLTWSDSPGVSLDAEIPFHVRDPPFPLRMCQYVRTLRMLGLIARSGMVPRQPLPGIHGGLDLPRAFLFLLRVPGFAVLKESQKRFRHQGAGYPIFRNLTFYRLSHACW